MYDSRKVYAIDKRQMPGFVSVKPGIFSTKTSGNQPVIANITYNEEKIPGLDAFRFYLVIFNRNALNDIL